MRRLSLFASLAPIVLLPLACSAAPNDQPTAAGGSGAGAGSGAAAGAGAGSGAGSSNNEFGGEAGGGPCEGSDCTATCQLAEQQPSNVECQFWTVDLDQADGFENDPASAPWGVALSN